MKFYKFSIIVLIHVLISCTNKEDPFQDRNGPHDSNREDTVIVDSIITKIAHGGYPDTETALNLLKQAETLALNAGYDDGIAKVLFHAGNLYYSENLYHKALESYSKSLLLAEKVKNLLLKAQCLERMGSVNLLLGDDHYALKLYYEALPLFEKTNDKEGVAKVYNIIGLYKSGQGENDSAKVYFLQAMKLNKETGNQTGLVHNKGNLAYLLENTGRYEEADSMYHELIVQLIKSGDSLNLPVVYYNSSSLYQKMGLSDSAIVYIHSALLICEKTKDTALLSVLYGNLGELYIDKKKYDSAYHFLNLSEKCCQSTGDVETEVQTQKLLLRMDTLTGDFRNTTNRYRQIISLSDSVYAKKQKNNLKSIELQYDLQKKSSQLELQALKIRTTQKQKHSYLILFFFSGFTSLLLIILVIFIAKNSKKRRKISEEEIKIKNLQIENFAKASEISKLNTEKMETDIKQKEQEQMNNALALEQKNELLTMIDKKFREAMEKSGSLDMEELNILISAVKMQVRQSADPDFFHLKFSSLYPDFYDNLKSAYPKLTKSDLKFCAYLKLRLTTKQIAKIANVTIEAIRKTRYRIRKKLHIVSSDSLEDYISKF